MFHTTTQLKEKMTTSMAVIVEAIVVGGGLAVLMAVAHAMGHRPSSVGQAALLGFIMGAFFHIACELSGINKWYCMNGAACR
jgi:ABC-type arginine/histidine transport system permease subunit